MLHKAASCLGRCGRRLAPSSIPGVPQYKSPLLQPWDRKRWWKEEPLAGRLSLVPRDSRGWLDWCSQGRKWREALLASQSFLSSSSWSPSPAFYTKLHLESHSRNLTPPSHLQPLEPCPQLSHLPWLPPCWSHCVICFSSVILLM